MSRYAGRLPRDYASALRMLNGKRSRKVLNNTVMRETVGGDAVVVQYHGNEIARFYSNGEVMLTNCGYGTVSTRERLSAMTPAGVYFVQRNHEQRVQVPSQGIDVAAGAARIGRDRNVTV